MKAKLQKELRQLTLRWSSNVHSPSVLVDHTPTGLYQARHCGCEDWWYILGGQKARTEVRVWDSDWGRPEFESKTRQNAARARALCQCLFTSLFVCLGDSSTGIRTHHPPSSPLSPILTDPHLSYSSSRPVGHLLSCLRRLNPRCCSSDLGMLILPLLFTISLTHTARSTNSEWMSLAVCLVVMKISIKPSSSLPYMGASCITTSHLRCC